MNQPLRVAVYARVSTSDQSTEIQVNDLTHYAASRNWTIYKTYQDKKTGKNDHRSSFQSLMMDARSRKIDCVLCWKLDRLFRSLKGLITTLEEFTELGIAFVSIKDSMDLSTSSGRLMMQMIGAFAEFERSLIIERVRAGIANARAKGTRLGRPKIRDDQKILVLREQGCSLRKIAANLNISKGAVQRSLSAVPKTLWDSS